MDGQPHDRDDLGDTQISRRLGRKSTSGDGAYGDGGRPDGAGVDPLPHRLPPPGGPGASRWGEPEGQWAEAGNGGGPPSGGYPEYSRLPYGPPNPGGRVGPPDYGPNDYGPHDYGPNDYGPGNDAPQSGFGQRPLGREEAPAFGRPQFGREEQVRDEYGRARHGRHESGGGERDTGGFPAVSPSGRPPIRPYEPRGEARPRRGNALERVRTRALARRSEPVEDDEEKSADRGPRRSMPLWQELPLLLVVAFCLAVLIRTFLLQAFFIPSGSMEQTLLVGDRVLVNKIVYDVRTPERGEVVVFRGTDNWDPENFDEPAGGLLSRIGRTMGDLVGVSRPGEKDFIKRVIGLPGDRISCCDPSGRVYVNGQGIDEPYVLNNSPEDVPPDPRLCRSRRFDEVLVPPGQIFVMGDHRIVSQDSRCQGPVPIENVIGRAFVIVWPSGRWDTLDVPETFSDVPGPVAIGPPPRMDAKVRAGAAFITMPVLASLVVTTCTGRKPRWGRRTLRR